MAKDKTLKVTHPSLLQDKPVVWIDTPRAVEGDEIWGEKAASGGGYRNRYEAYLLRELLRDLDFDVGRRALPTLMVLSPYRAQVFALRRVLRRDGYWDDGRTIEFQKRGYPQHRIRKMRRLASMKPSDNTVTVDSAQGRQAEIVVVSLVRNNAHDTPDAALGFLQNQQRLGVMFSRAERLLVIIGCADHFAQFEGYHLAKAIEVIRGSGGLVKADKLYHAKAMEKARLDLERRQSTEREE